MEVAEEKHKHSVQEELSNLVDNSSLNSLTSNGE